MADSALHQVNALNAPDDNALETAIGVEVRTFRRDLGMTLQDVSRVTGLSVAMMSKIENGQTAPSLATLKALSKTFDVPINIFFRSFEERRDASFVRSGEGVQIARRGRSIAHNYRLIGHCANSRVAFEPYIVHLTADSETFPRTQESGVWFIHMLCGELIYRYGDNEYRLQPGDSLTYDADAPHGIERVVKFPVTFLCSHADRRDG
jgi:transcriptional regulator with XRE-family HTH domain